MPYEGDSIFAANTIAIQIQAAWQSLSVGSLKETHGFPASGHPECGLG